MNAVTELLPSKHPVGSRHNNFLRHITLRDLTVAGKCNKSGWNWANSGLTKTTPKHPLAKKSHRTKELGSEARHQEREQRQKQESQTRQGQPRWVVRATEMFRVRLTRVCVASPTRPAEREATLRNLLWRGHLVLVLPTRLAATKQGQARRMRGWANSQGTNIR